MKSLPWMQENAIPCLDWVQLYDGTGRHWTNTLLPIMVDNQLTDSYDASLAIRPVADALYLNQENFNRDLAWVWMLPIGMTPKTLVPQEIAGHLVQAVEAHRMVLVYGDDPAVVAGIRAMVGQFVGGGHA